jgi:putative flippase GtrA
MIGLKLIKFGIVGIVALTVHFIVAIVLVTLKCPPLLANLAGFLIAFQFSFVGHSLWTFELTGKNRGKQKIRFFTVAILGFLINELSYFFLISFLNVDYRIALFFVLFFVSALTFILSQLWAFKEGNE